MKQNQAYIAVSNDISVVTKRKAKPHIFLIELVAMLLCILGCVVAIDKGLGMKFSPLIYILSVVTGAAFTLVYRMHKFRAATVLSIITLFIWIGTAYIKTITYALLVLNGRLIYNVNRYFGAQYNYYTPAMDKAEERSCLLALSICIPFILGVLIGLIIVNIKSPIILFVCTLPFIFISTSFTDSIYIVPILMIISSIIMTYSMRISLINTSGNGKKTISFGNLNNRTHIISEHNVNHLNIIPNMIIMLVIIAIIISALAAFGIFKNIKPKESETSIMETTIDFFANEGYKNIFSGINLYGDASGGIGGSKKLGGNNSITFNNEVHLKINQSTFSPSYLKGFVGSEYSDSRWSELDSTTINKYSDMFKQFNELKLSPHYVGKEFSQYISEKGWFGVNNISNTIETTIENVRANSNYIYTPYFPAELPSLKNYEDDGSINVKNNSKSKKYTIMSYEYYDTNTSDYRTISSSVEDWSAEYGSQFRLSSNATGIQTEYSKFAYDVYTKLPEGELTQLKREAASLERVVIEKNDQKAETDTIYTAAKVVREYIQNGRNYDLAPGKTPTGTDFAEYFLYTNKKGYCAHFATSATLLLRAMGYPARYVEGYVVTQSDINTAKQKNSDTIEIMDTNAHSWIEIYDKNLGWVPIEMTPRYAGEDVPTNTEESIPSSSEQAESEVSEASSSVPSEISSEISSDISSSASSNATSNTTSDTSTNVTSDITSNVTSTDSENGMVKPSTIELKWLIQLIMLFIIIGVIILLIWLRRKLILTKRLKLFNQADKRNAVIELYNHITKLILQYEIAVSNYINLQDYAAAVIRKCDIEKFDLVTEIALKSKFSKSDIPDNEYELVRACSSDLETELLSSSSTLKRIKLKYIDAIL